MTLFVVGTPIGNLEDITLRAIRVLKEADWVAAENVAQTKKLLTKYEIKTPVVRVHQHSRVDELERVIGYLQQDLTVAYVSDAGTPTIADPGGRLVELAREAGAKIVPIPGPSAVTTLLSVAGIPADSFMFVGFLPKKKGRQTLVRELAELDVPIVLFESPNRLVKTLKEIQTTMGERGIIVGRELTKIYEEVISLPIETMIKHFLAHPPKGEVVVIIKPDL